jgi:hypothetical protein
VGKRKTDRSKRNLKIERDAREKTVPVRDGVAPRDDIEEKVDEVHENRDQTCVCRSSEAITVHRCRKSELFHSALSDRVRRKMG